MTTFLAGLRSRAQEDADERGSIRSLGDVNAAHCVCILLLLTIFLPADQIIPGPGLPPTDVFSALLAFLWLGLHLGRNLPVAKGPTPIRTALLLLLLALAISFAMSVYGYLPEAELQSAIHKIVLSVSVVGTSLFIGDTVRTHIDVRRIIRTLVVCTSVVAALGIVETLVGQNFVAQVRVPGLTPTNFAGFTQAPRDELVRAQSTAGHPIEFGVLCAMVLPFSVHLATGSARRRGRSLSWLLVGILAAGCIFSVSRSAIIGLVIVVIIMLASAPSNERWRSFFYILVATAALWFVVPRVFSVLAGFFLASPDDPSVTSRTDDYTAVIDQLEENPLFGGGPGTWFAPAHRILDNQYLVTVVEIGLLGLTATLLALIVPILRGVRLLHGRAAADQRLGIACVASMVVVVTTYATFDFASFSTVNTIAFVVIGITMSLDRGAARSAREIRDGRPGDDDFRSGRASGRGGGRRSHLSQRYDHRRTLGQHS